MWRSVRMAVLATAAMLAISSIVWAQRDWDGDRDDDDHYRGNRDGGQARQYGYERGYRDGVEKGRHEGRERDPYDYQTPDWRQATRGYERWMGPVGLYQRGYQDGYRNGFSAGYREVTDRWFDRDGRWRNDGWRTGYDPDWSSIANRYGYEDGAQVAREDIYNRKRYNSKPRARFEDRDHGYRREYGDKDRYKAEYTAGYRAGYDSVMSHSY